MSEKLRVVIAQLNATVGHVTKNCDALIEAAKDILDKAEKDLNSKRDDIADSGTNLVSNKPVPTGWTQIKRDED